ncbi:MAG: type II toxin-antitoxin system RelE/ParE family toxin [Gammaproteobacteria bacterium]
MDKQLMHQPMVITKNRKFMKSNLLAVWELRIDKLRVFYNVADDPEKLVYVRAIDIKKRNRVWIGGEEFAL